jgi:hypothetical protein
VSRDSEAELSIPEGEHRVSKRTACRSLAVDGDDLATLIEEIQRGNVEAEVAFLKICSGGIHYILKRNVGAGDLPACLERVQLAMLNRIRAGWTPENGRITPLVYEAVAACGIVPSPAAERRQNAPNVEAIKNALSGLTTREREALTRYYLRGEDPRDVMNSLGFTPESFESLIARLKDVPMKKLSAKEAAAGRG